MADITYVTIPELTAALDSQVDDSALLEMAVVDANGTNGYSSKKVTKEQLLSSLKDDLDNISVFVTPEMFGAKGDGVTDDTQAMCECFAHPYIILKKTATYKVDYIDVTSDITVVEGSGAKILFNSARSGEIGSTDNIYKTECLSNRRTRNDATFNTFIIRNVRFDGGGASFTNYSDYNSGYTELCLLQLFNYKVVTIESCIFYDTIQNAIDLSGCVKVVVRNNVFDKIAHSTKLDGTKNAITAHHTASANGSTLDVYDNTFSYVYDECVAFGDYATVNISNNAIDHCYQYAVEAKFNYVVGYSVCCTICNNSVTELADSFINVGSAIATSCRFSINNNVIVGLGSANLSDNAHSTNYGSNLIQCAYNSAFDISIAGNTIDYVDYAAKTTPLINVPYARLALKDNAISINNSVTLGALISVAELFAVNNKIVVSVGKTPTYTSIIANANRATLSGNYIAVTVSRFMQMTANLTAEYTVTDNYINGINASTGNLVYSQATCTINNLIVIGNVIKTGKYMTYKGVVDNLMYVNNVVPAAFVLPTSDTTYNHTVNDNNTATA